MISDKLSARRHELTQRGEPFVTATVVRVQHPTSVEPGSVALVRGDGTIEGFVGGVCAEHSVRLYSLKAIDSGEPLLLRIMPDVTGSEPGSAVMVDDPSAAEEVASADGAVTVRNPCLSGGAIEIFLEPALPPPRITVAGDSLIANAIRGLGAELGLEIAAGAPSADDLALIVAAHGRDELSALRMALEADVPYVGLVASPKRGAGVLEELRADGVSEELLGRIDTPAGLNIGARTPAEIALSILARVVEVRRRGDGVAARPRSAGAEPLMAEDPICGMSVVVGSDTVSSAHDGETFYFCCEGCRSKFDERRAVASRS
jgi:xanthine dehydrogenase accessory factor